MSDISYIGINESTSWYPDNTTAPYPYTVGDIKISSWSSGYNYPTYIYMYQITCPKCSTLNWCQLDNIINCSKCKSKLKAVKNSVDYEVPVK